MKIIVKIVSFVIFIAVVSVWAVVGFLFWIPILARVTMIFSSLIFHAAITKQNPDSLKEYLDAAVSFYPNGFRTAYAIFSFDSTRIISEAPPLRYRFDIIFYESFLSIVFWLSILWLITPEIATPILSSGWLLASSVLQSIFLLILSVWQSIDVWWTYTLTFALGFSSVFLLSWIMSNRIKVDIL
jgi:hypothetical protein